MMGENLAEVLQKESAKSCCILCQSGRRADSCIADKPEDRR